MKNFFKPASLNEAQQTAKKMVQELIRPHRKSVIIALILNLVVGISVAFQNVVPKYIIDDALLKEGLSINEKKQRLLMYAACYVFVGIVMRAWLWHGSLRIFGKVHEDCVSQLRARFFNHVNRLCISFHHRHNSGELFSYLFGSPLGNIQQYYRQVAMMLPSQAVSLVMTLLFLGSWDLLLTGIIILSVGVHFAVQTHARLQMRKIHHDYQQTEAAVSGKVADMLRGHQAMKLHAVEDSAARDFNKELVVIHQKAYRRDVRSHLQQVKQESVLYVGYAILCITAGWRFLGGEISQGQLTAYLTSFIALQGPLQTFFQIALLKGSSQASMERLGNLLATQSSTPEPEQRFEEPPRNGDIQLNDVSFAYNQTPVLRNVTITIPYGQKVALVGPSGAGKSTIAQLLLRLYDPQSGNITFDNIDLKNILGSEHRRRFGVVPQDPYMFNCSLRDNLTLVDAHADDAKLQKVLEEANAWEFVKQMPNGLDTLLGEGGSMISGGQRQRLAIARALLTDPSYFVFDEATSALDTLSEQLIKEAMNRVTEGKTAIFIAHRLASVENLDRILVVVEGQIVQDGRYDELAVTPGTFQDLLKTQTLH
ncbi:ABC transporter ATP-binding protein [Kiritimatiellota bacterium B12222]|nr:ABC transporter ATP-binding protein [Kiritimatiellota bacterium B12222]